MTKALAACLMSIVLIAVPAFARGGHGGGRRGGGHTRGNGHTRGGGAHGSGHKQVHGTRTSTPDKVHVNGYVTKKGTRVEPHNRTRANDTKSDNWSTKGNVNPETKKTGTKPLHRSGRH
ncbi:MAG TPA: hypothetical protein VJZ76_07780 [Thermoanaerobaculia bacterium]|nr:hypothetical protein [Thermoanaerobaculia bacterium]